MANLGSVTLRMNTAIDDVSAWFNADVGLTDDDAAATEVLKSTVVETFTGARAVRSSGYTARMMFRGWDERADGNPRDYKESFVYLLRLTEMSGESVEWTSAIEAEKAVREDQRQRQRQTESARKEVDQKERDQRPDDDNERAGVSAAFEPRK